MPPRTARRYHWHSRTLRSFTEEPHVAVVGDSQGDILNLVHRDAVRAARHRRAAPGSSRIIAKEAAPGHAARHQVESSDINLQRLGAVLAVAHDAEIKTFADALLLPGMGPRALQALALVSEVIHGTPAVFSDPARFRSRMAARTAGPSRYQQTFTIGLLRCLALRCAPPNSVTQNG